MGLLGMSLLTTQRRTKEIGIRKVDGARIYQIMIMLNWDFIKWIVISFAIAIPFPGTDLYQYCVDDGINLPKWGNFGSVNSLPIPLNDSLGAVQLMKLRRIAVSRFFKRPAYLFRMFRRFNALAVFSDFARMYLALQRESRAQRF